MKKTETETEIDTEIFAFSWIEIWKKMSDKHPIDINSRVKFYWS